MDENLYHTYYYFINFREESDLAEEKRLLEEYKAVHMKVRLL